MMSYGYVHYLKRIEVAIQQSPDTVAMEDFGTNISYTYRDMAVVIAKLQIFFKKIGLKQGEKVAFCGRNSSNWGVSFFATQIYGAVPVSILPDFTSEDIYGLVKHSDAKVFFASESILKRVDQEQLKTIHTLVNVSTFEVIKSPHARLSWDTIETAYTKEYPNGLDLSQLHYPCENDDDLALINYTSGTTSDPKGVMLSYRSLSNNVSFGLNRIPNGPTKTMVSILPLAHMFGLMYDFTYQIAGGTKVVFITTPLAPQVMLKAFAQEHPYMILVVPLVIEKIFKKSIFPKIKTPLMKFLWNLPVIGPMVRQKVHNTLVHVFGDKMERLIIGGAALNAEVEQCMQDIHFPYCVGYGMTECGPLIAYEDYHTYAAHSCGRIIDGMELRVDSTDPLHVEGEFQVRGMNVMQGYYKNPKATKATFTKDGWLKTGDIGIVDADGNMFIRGRNKNMLLGPSGQNIYPEEIEDKLNNLPFVTESVIVQRNTKLIALIYSEDVEKYGFANVEKKMHENLKVLNTLLPKYSEVVGFELQEKEFAKTPKKSIRRFLYK